MDEKLRNRRILVVGLVAAVVAYAGYRSFVHPHHIGWHIDTDDDKPSRDNAAGSAAGNESAEVTLDSKSGGLGIKIPGFSATVNVPGINLDKGDFDIDGVKLYPGTKIERMGVKAAAHNDDDDKGSGSVALNFEAPATPPVVRAYFDKALKEHGFEIDSASTPEKIIATKAEGDKHVEISVAPQGAAATHGALAVSGD